MGKYQLHARLHSFISKQKGAKKWLFAYSSAIICVPSVRAQDLQSIVPYIPSEKSMFIILTGKTVGTTTEPV